MSRMRSSLERREIGIYLEFQFFQLKMGPSKKSKVFHGAGVGGGAVALVEGFDIPPDTTLVRVI